VAATARATADQSELRAYSSPIISLVRGSKPANAVSRMTPGSFHVAKLYRKSLDELRKKELKRLKKELPEADYKEFKGVLWLLRKNPEELTPEELEVVKGLFKYTPLLGAAYVFCYKGHSSYRCHQSMIASIP
jgi:hypothetical protein